MAGPDYHGWTHRPKADGGTDPIPTASYVPPTAIATKGLGNVTLTGYDILTFTSMYATPGGHYTPHGGNPASFQYVDLTAEGCYQADFVVFWSTIFTASTFPYIEAQCQIGGSGGNTLAASVSALWGFNTEEGWIAGEQFDAGELAHHSLYSRFVFNYTVADFDPSFGLGVAVRHSATGTKSLGGQIAVTRLGDPIAVVT